MNDFKLAHKLEQKFQAFGYHVPVHSDDFRGSPAEAIRTGLQHLEGVGVLSHEEFTEHLQNFKWEIVPLSNALNDRDARESIEALLRNLDFWKERNDARLSENE